MAYPTVYDVTYSYTGFQQSQQGISAFPGTQMDADLAGLESSVSALALFVRGVMRSDGALQNNIVTYESLAGSLQTAGLAPADPWLTATAYEVNTSVVTNGNLYRCLVAHTSGVFATDLAAAKWLLIGSLIGESVNGAVSVIASGADATGVADSSAAFAAARALSAAVVVPPGIYKLASPWVLAANSDVHFIGHPTLNFTAGTGAGVNITGGNVKLRGRATLDGQLSTDSYLSGHTAIQTSGSTAASTFDNIVIDELTITNWGDTGIHATHTTRFAAARNKISRVGRGGVMLLSATGARVNFNKIENVTPGSGGTAPYLNAYGITFTRNATDSLVTDPVSEDCEAIGNDIDGVPTWEGIDTHGGKNIRILHNTVKNCLLGVGVVPSNGPLPTYVSAVDVLIQGNSIDGANASGPGKSNGIYMSPASFAAGVSSGMRAIGNILRNCGTNDPATFAQGSAIYCSMTNAPVVADNMISNSDWSAINLENIVTDAVVSGNQIVGVNQFSSNKTGIRVSSATVSGVVTGNAFDGAFDGIDVTIAPSSGYGLQVPDTNTYVGGQAFKSTYASSNTFDDADYTLRPKDRVVSQVGTLTAARTVTLVAADEVAPGTRVLIYDASATASNVNTISVAVVGADTINGGAGPLPIIASPLGFAELVSDGVSAWLILAGRGAHASWTGGVRAISYVAGQLLAGLNSDSGLFTQAYPTLIEAVATNSDAAAGFVGEYASSVIASGSAVALTTATAANLTYLDLDEGDWDVDLVVNFTGNVLTKVAVLHAGLSLTSATYDHTNGRSACIYVSGSTALLFNAIALGVPPTVSVVRRRFSLAAADRVYGIGSGQFTDNTMSMYGTLTARRPR